MLILVISANPLFKEIIYENIPREECEIMELNLEEALTRICEFRPDVVIIDETITPPYFERILSESRSLEKARVIVLNPVQNEIVLLDSRRTILREMGDLKKAILNYKNLGGEKNAI